MISMSSEQLLQVVEAFQSAWLTLLSEERVRAENIDRLPALLVSAVLETARLKESETEDLATAALRRLTLYEFEVETTRVH
jgi:hypothetical protein